MCRLGIDLVGRRRSTVQLRVPLATVPRRAHRNDDLGVPDGVGGRGEVRRRLPPAGAQVRSHNADRGEEVRGTLQ